MVDKGKVIVEGRWTGIVASRWRWREEVANRLSGMLERMWREIMVDKRRVIVEERSRIIVENRWSGIVEGVNKGTDFVDSLFEYQVKVTCTSISYSVRVNKYLIARDQLNQPNVM